MNATLTLAEASPADYPGILALNEAAIPHVNSISTETLAHLHGQSMYLGVARSGDGALAGFLLALPPGADYGSINFGYFRDRYPRFAYIDRIVVSPLAQRGGVGVALYADLERRLPEDCELMTCEVNLRPPNPGSLAFHTRMGFEPVGEQDTEGGRKRVCLMARPLAGTGRLR